MSSDSLPMLRIIRKRGQIEVVEVGPAAGRTLTRCLLIIAGAALLAAGVVNWNDVASTVSMLRVW